MKSTFFTILTLLALNVHADNNKEAAPLTIGFGSGNQPYTMMDKQMIRAEGHEKHFGIEYSIIKQATILMHYEIKPKSIPPRELKRSIKKFRGIDIISGVTRSRKDKLYYSNPILEIAYIAVSKNSLNAGINSISNLSGFNVIARTGSYATIKDGYSKLYHPRKGSHKHKYKEYDSSIKMHADFWKAGSEAVLITTKESLDHFRMLLAGTHDTNEDVTINEIFPTKTRLYVAFKNKHIRKEFNEALEDLKFEGTYTRIFDHYNHEKHPDFHKPNHNEIIRQLRTNP
jgi:ABC-type amino acid transport substrate-binding protein